MASRLFLKLLLYFSVLILVISGINRLLSARVQEDLSQWQELFHESARPNVIILGASHAASGIDPEFLERDGVRVYNFATCGDNPATTLKWYRRLFRKYHSKPKVAIYEVDWFMFDSEWLSLKYENLSHFLPQRIFLEEMLAGDNNLEMLMLNRFPLFYLDVASVLHKAPPAAAKEPKEAKVGYKGFIYNDFPPLNLNEPRFVSARVFDEQKLAFLTLLDQLREDGVAVIFVQAPEFVSGRSCATIGSINAFLRSVAGQKGIPFLNFNEELRSGINANDRLYSDWGHLNRDGSRVFTQLLSAKLAPHLGALGLGGSRTRSAGNWAAAIDKPVEDR